MIILVTLGVLLAMPIGLAIATAIRGRRSGPVNQIQIDAGKANSLITTDVPGGHHFGTYLRPPDDGRPPH